MTQKEQIITVSMTLNTKGFEQGLTLSDKQAKAMGKTIAEALTIDTTAPINALKSIGIEKDKLIGNFLKLKETIKDTFNIDVSTVNAKLISVGTQLDSITTKANAAAAALKKVADGTSTSRSTNTSSSKKTTTTPKARTGSALDQELNPPTFIGRTEDKYDPKLSTRAGVDAKEQRQLEEVRRINAARTTAQIIEEEKKAAAAYIATTKIAVQSSATVAQVSTASTDKIISNYGRINKAAKESSDITFGSFQRIFSANFLAEGLANMFTGAFRSLQNLSAETAKYAARTEELGVVLNSLARVNNVSTATINQQEVAVQRLNITTQDTRETIARFMNVGFDLKKAGPLARVAQDLAVIGNLSTSAELDKLTVAIQTLQSRNLRSAGVFITVDEVLDKLSQTTGRARDSFSTLEKQTAVLNAVLDYGSRAAGTYEAAMETTSKQLRSMERYFYEAQNAVGEGLVPALQVWVDVSTAVLKVITLMPNTLINVIKTIGLMTAAVILLKTQMLQTFAIGVGNSVVGAARALSFAYRGKEDPRNPSTATKVQQLKAEQLITRENQKQAYFEDKKQKTVLLGLEATKAELVAKRLSTVEIEKQIALQRANVATSGVGLASATAANAKVGSDITAARVGGAASALGVVGLGVAGVAALYTAASAVTEYRDSLYQLNGIDLSASQKTAKDLIRISKDLAKLEESKVNTPEDARKVVDGLSILSRARISSELKNLDIQTNITDEMRKQLKIQLEQEAIALKTKQASVAKDALTQIRKSSNNKDDTTELLLKLNEAEKIIQEKLNATGDGPQSDENIDLVSYARFYASNAITELDRITMLGGTSKGQNYVDQAGQANGDAETLTLFLNQVQDEIAKAGLSADKELEKRKQAISDYLKVSIDAGTSDVDLFNNLKKNGGLTEVQLQEVTQEIRKLRAEADEEIRIQVAFQTKDGLEQSFDSFYDAFKKQRDKKVEEILKVQEQDGKFGKSPLDRFRARASRDATLVTQNVGYLNSQVGKEGIDNLKASIAQDLRRNPDKAAKTIFDEQLKRLTEKGEAGQDLVAALKARKESLQYNQEAEALVDEYNKLNEQQEAKYNLKKIINEDISSKLETFSITKATGELESFVQQSITLGSTAEDIEKVRANYQEMAAIDPTGAVDYLRRLNAVNKEAILLDQARKNRADNSSIDVRNIRDLTSIENLESDVFSLKQPKNSRILELEAEKKTLTEVQASRDKLNEARAGKNPEVAQNERAAKLLNDIRSAEEKLIELRQGRNPRLVALEKEVKVLSEIQSAQERLKELKEGQDPNLVSLQRQVKIEEAIKKVKDEQFDIEDEIAILKRTIALPVVNSQLLAEKAMLQLVKDRRTEEQKLTADIAVEMAKRINAQRNAVRNISRLTAEVFLDRQKESSNTTDSAIKSIIDLKFEQGMGAIFENNPLIQEAAVQSEKLAAIEKNGGVMGQKADLHSALLKGGVQQSINNTIATQNSIKTSADYQVQATVTSTNQIVAAIQQMQLAQQSQMMNQQPIGNGAPIKNTESQAQVQRIFESSFSKYFSPQGAARLTSTLRRETTFNASYANREFEDPRSKEWWKYGKKPIAPIMDVGMLSWNGDRRDNFINSFLRSRGKTLQQATPQDNADFVIYELMNNKNYKKYGDVLRNPNSTEKDVAKAVESYVGFHAKHRGEDESIYRQLYGNRFVGVGGGSGYNQPVNTMQVTQDAAELKKQQDEAMKNKAEMDKKNAETLQATLDRLGLSREEFDKSSGAVLRENGNMQYPGAKTIGQLVAAAEVMAELKKYFGTTDIYAEENQYKVKALDDYSKKEKEYLRDRKIKIEADVIEEYNLKTLQERAYQNVMDEYDDEFKFETRYGESTRRGQLEATALRSADLRNRKGTFYTKTIGESDVDRAKNYQATLENLVKLERERNVRATEEGKKAYIEDQKVKFIADQISVMNELEDKEEQLALQREAFADKDSQYNNNRIREIEYQRNLAEQTLKEETKNNQEYNDSYLNSLANRTRISKEADNQRLVSYRELVESMIKLDADYGHANDNLQLELLQKQKEIRNSQETEYKDRLKRQLELEEEFRRKSDPLNQDELRNRGLEKINSSMKDSTTLMSDLLSDTFDGVSAGFGGVIDKLFDRMGIFGEAVSNLFKGIVNNILGTLTKSILDTIAPQNEIVSDVINGDVGAPATTDQATQQILQTSVSVVDASNNLIVANNGVASGAVALGNTFASVATAMIGIVEQAGIAIANIIASIPVGGGAGGVGTVGGAVNTNAISAAAQAGISQINNTTIPTSTNTPTVGATTSSTVATAGSGGNVKGTIASKASGALSGLFSGQSLKSIGKASLASLPMLGAGFGGMLGGPSKVGTTLGQLGGGIIGTLGMGIGSSLLAGTGGGIFGAAGSTGSIGVLGLSGAATLGIGLAVAGAFMVGSYLFGRAKRRREEKRKVTEVSGNARKQLEDLLKSVRSDKIDGEEAITRAQEIRDEYVKETASLKTKPGKKQAAQELMALDGLIAQIKSAAKTQAIRREIDERIVPTYATGGVGSGLIRVSQGESLFVPHSEGLYGGHQIAAGGIPNFAGGGSYTGVKIRGNFDGKDNILARVPKGTVIANPRQVSKIRSSQRFATGGVAGRTASSSTAQGTITVQPPSVTAIIVFSPEEAERLGRQIPNSVIVGKVRQHVQQTGTTGLAGDIANSYR